MKGIAGRATRGLPVGAKLTCIDNTGAKVLTVITVIRHGGTHRRIPTAAIGDMVKVSVKKGKPEFKKQILNAVVVRQRRSFRRPDGMMIQFEDNAAVITAPNGDVKGSMIKGPVAKEAAERWPRIAALSSMIV
ncbi:MAG TPA: 50S ribosomal protein L14 [Thermoplasmata archaeon]|nr:50S ribosomal protein L14 [Thermoplasmata archaeon]HIH97938.1 50S ribosomal protein L14 [Thermoplasmata archaeon]